MNVGRRSILASLALLTGAWSRPVKIVERSGQADMQGDDVKPAPPPANSSRLPSLPEGWKAVAYAVLSGGQLAIVGSDADLEHEWRRDADGRVLGNPSEVAAKASARIWSFDGSTLETGPAFSLQTPFPKIDRFADGRWLVAASRKWDDLHDRIIAEDGGELKRLRLGDGIMHLKIDSSDRIWVGWFDEGVFGNDSWRVPGLEWPPSAYGLAAFDDEGSVLTVSSGAAPDYQIADCYALNVSADEAWACTYPGSPISMSAHGAPFRWWETSLPGSVALAVAEPHFLAAGGFGEKSDRVILGHLQQSQAVLRGEWKLPFSVGYPSSVEFVDARDHRLHVVANGVWHTWEISQFLT